MDYKTICQYYIYFVSVQCLRVRHRTLPAYLSYMFWQGLCCCILYFYHLEIDVGSGHLDIYIYIVYKGGLPTWQLYGLVYLLNQIIPDNILGNFDLHGTSSGVA